MELKALLSTQALAALGTVHAGEPFVSMVPYAIDHATATLWIHVSTLAAHTRHMQAQAQISMLITAHPSPHVTPQETPRLTIQGVALPVDKTSEAYAAGKITYLKRFAQSEYLFDFSDFSLFAITPTSARWVAGFAKAMSLSRAELIQALNQTSP